MASEPLWDAKQLPVPAEELKFVDVKDGAQIDESHRAIIRSQVMLDFYKKQLQQDLNREPSDWDGSHLATANSPAKYMNRFRVVTRGSRNRRRMEVSKRKMTESKNQTTQLRTHSPAASQPQLVRTTPKPEDLLSQHLIALTPLPEGNPLRLRALTHLYFTERGKSSQLMLNLRKGFFQLAMQDSAFFSACISHYAGVFSLITREGDPTESIKMRMRSMALVNSRLSEPALGISDGTVGAVTSIINYETYNGTLLAARTHLAGLKTMLRMRGGFLQAKFSPLLQRMIAWAELMSAYYLYIEPTIIPFDNPGLDLPSRISHISPFLRSRSTTDIILPKPSTYDIIWNNIDKDPASIFTDLRFLSSALASQETEISSIDPLWYSDKIYLVQRSLVCMAMNPEPHHTNLDTACYITASLYADFRLRDLGIRTVAISSTVSRLRALLPQVFQDLPQFVGSSESVNRMLWVLVFAGIAANWRPERSWFVEKLGSTCQILKLKSWIDVTSLLESVLWDEEWETPHGLLWGEVEDYLKHIKH